MKVVVSFELSYGLGADLHEADAFWLIDSPANRAFFDSLQEAGKDPNSAVFQAGESLSDEDAEERFHDVDLHHPDWTAVEFRGVSLTPDLAADFASRGFAVRTVDHGFTVERD